MAYLAKYKKSDFKKVSWKEYNKTLEILLKKLQRYIKKHKIKIDAVVPILRGGAFQAHISHLSCIYLEYYRFNINIFL